MAGKPVICYPGFGDQLLSTISGVKDATQGLSGEGRPGMALVFFLRVLEHFM